MPTFQITAKVTLTVTKTINERNIRDAWVEAQELGADINLDEWEITNIADADDMEVDRVEL